MSLRCFFGFHGWFKARQWDKVICKTEAFEESIWQWKGMICLRCKKRRLVMNKKLRPELAGISQILWEQGTVRKHYLAGSSDRHRTNYIRRIK